MAVTLIHFLFLYPFVDLFAFDGEIYSGLGILLLVSVVVWFFFLIVSTKFLDGIEMGESRADIYRTGLILASWGTGILFVFLSPMLLYLFFMYKIFR